MTGSLLQLKYVGNESKIFIGNPQIYFFKSVFKSYSNFGKVQDFSRNMSEVARKCPGRVNTKICQKAPWKFPWKSRCPRNPCFLLIFDWNLIPNEFVRTCWASAIACASNVQRRLESPEAWIAHICKSKHPLINAMLHLVAGWLRVAAVEPHQRSLMELSSNAMTTEIRLHTET